MAMAVAQHLRDLRNPELTVLLPDEARNGVDEELPVQVVNQHDDGYEKGYADAKAAGEERHAREIADLEAAFETRLSEQRRCWAEQTAGELASQLRSQGEALGETLSAMLRERARPVIKDLIRQSAIVQMKHLVQRLLEEAVLVRVSGPEELLKALQHELADTADQVRFIENGETELQLKAGATQAQSSIDFWLDQWRGTDHG